MNCHCPATLVRRRGGAFFLTNVMVQEQKTWIARAVRRIFRPVIRLLIAYDLNLPWLVEELKGIYVHVASELLKVGDKAVPQSRISLVTGVHRKDVKRLLDAPTEIVPPKNRVDMMIGHWVGDPSFCDSNGKPLPLPRSAQSGGPSFQALADYASRKDINDGTILRDLIDRGLVQLDAQDRVVLNVDALVPDKEKDLESLAFFFGQNEGDHINAGVGNIIADGEAPYLDRAVYHDGLTAEDVAQLEVMAREQSLALLQSLNREAHRMTKAKSGNLRFNFGVYFFHEEKKKEEP